MAFEAVCPERIDLIHKNYRKLCNLLVDVDEWGQATILNMLTRYARTQFIDPNKEVSQLRTEETPRKCASGVKYVLNAQGPSFGAALMEGVGCV